MSGAATTYAVSAPGGSTPSGSVPDGHRGEDVASLLRPILGIREDLSPTSAARTHRPAPRTRIVESAAISGAAT